MNMTDQIVHATGINWVGISPIMAVIIAGLTLIVTMQNRRDKKHESANLAIKEEISSSVEHLGEVLSARMETKETVARISERLARLEGAANAGRDRENNL